MQWNIKKAKIDQIDRIMSIYEYARVFMRENGNPMQWGDVHPPRALIESDIERQKLYVCLNGEEIAGEEIAGDEIAGDEIAGDEIACVFYFDIEDDPTYRVIENGAWLDDKPYGVVHRIASAKGSKGAATFCLNWAYEQAGNIRIDTHEDNKPMRGLLEKLGFVYCGIIYVLNRSPRMAFHKVK